jgi:hypothetical protein
MTSAVLVTGATVREALREVIDPELDVRPLLERGEEPFSLIMAAVARMPQEGALRLRTTFEPVPLYPVLARRGLTHASRRLSVDDWETVFRRNTIHLDVTDLVPPEPRVRILEAAAQLESGQTLLNELGPGRVHVNTLSVIAATIFGASYQLLPVVLGVPIASIRLARLSWWFYLPALPLFLLGLSQVWLAPLALGGTLLFGAVALYVGIVIATLRRAEQHDVVFWHLAVATVGLATAASLGLLLAFGKRGAWLGELTLPLLAAHATLMLGGWVTPMPMGVAYRLVGMFTLSEDRLHEGWAWAALACVAAGAWSLALGLLGAGSLLEQLGAASLLAGLLLFAVQLAQLDRARRRRQFDIHIPFALRSCGVALGAAAALSQVELLSHLSAAGLSIGAILFLSNAVRVGAHWRRPHTRITQRRTSNVVDSNRTPQHAWQPGRPRYCPARSTPAHLRCVRPACAGSGLHTDQRSRSETALLPVPGGAAGPGPLGVPRARAGGMARTHWTPAGPRGDADS